MNAPEPGFEPGPDLAEWLLEVARRVPGTLAAGLYERSTAGGRPVLQRRWPAQAHLPAADLLVEPLLRSGGSAVQTLDANHCLVAHAYLVPKGPLGVLLLHIKANAADHLQVQALSGEVAREAWSSAPRARPRARLSSGAANRPVTSGPSRTAAATAAVAAAPSGIEWTEVVSVSSAALAQADLDGAALAVAEVVLRRFGCDRVSIGVLDHADAPPVIRACAPSIDLSSQRSLTRTIEAAMDECAALGDVLQWPAPEEPASRIVMAHSALAREAQDLALASIPLPCRAHADGAQRAALSGVMTLERLGPIPFSHVELSRLRRIASLVGPALALHRQARPSWWRRAWRGAEARLKAWGVPLRPAAMAAGGFIATVAVLASVLQVTHQVKAPARVEGVVQRSLVAPNDGFIKAAHVRPGDIVKAGDLLAEMAREELLLSERRWMGELAQTEGSYGVALASQDRAQVVVQSARAEEAAAQLALVRQQMNRSEIRAPFDGVVITGDLSQSLGAPAKRGDVLMRVAPAEGWRVMLEVDEGDVAEVRIGAEASLVLAAQPGHAIRLAVSRITPVATSRDGRTFYEVEASPSEASPALRPGMTGIVRLDAGERSVAWLASHRLIARLRYAAWAWIG